MSRRIGDECYICPSCGGPTSVINHGHWEADRQHNRPRFMKRMDLVKCERCGVVFAVDDKTIPEDE